LAAGVAGDWVDIVVGAGLLSARVTPDLANTIGGVSGAYSIVPAQLQRL
jgi:hypothetical protein